MRGKNVIVSNPLKVFLKHANLPNAIVNMQGLDNLLFVFYKIDNFLRQVYFSFSFSGAEKLSLCCH